MLAEVDVRVKRGRTYASNWVDSGGNPVEGVPRGSHEVHSALSGPCGRGALGIEIVLFLVALRTGHLDDSYGYCASAVKLVRLDSLKASRLVHPSCLSLVLLSIEHDNRPSLPEVSSRSPTPHPTNDVGTRGQIDSGSQGTAS